MQLILFWMFSFSAMANSGLMSACGKQDLDSCEKLGLLFLSQEDWDKAFMIGEALCKRENFRGCMIAGSSSLMLGKFIEGKNYLQMACDAMEPYSCRSLGRLMDKAQDKSSSQLYFRRACYYGLYESCEGLPTKVWYSPAALGIVQNVQEDCKGDNGESCAQHLRAVKACALPLTKQDCLQLSSYLSIYFHGKYQQMEAKLLLLAAYENQKNNKKYVYDFQQLMKGSRPYDKANYIVGFMRSCGQKFASRKAKTNSREIYPQAYRMQPSRTTANILGYFGRGKADECYDPKVGFEIWAVANLDTLNPTRMDVWKIDQDKRIDHFTNGLPLP